jgi:hypothetical protein
MLFVEAILVFALIALIWMLITLVIFKKLNRAKINGVALILLAFVAVAAVIIIMGHFLEWHETNEFCGEMCHAMEGPYNSYTQPKNNTFMQVHYENDVPCAQCHSGPGFIGLGTSFLPVPKEMLGEYITGYDPDDFGGHVPSENCLKGCHEDAKVDWKFQGPMPKGEGYFEINGEGQWQLKDVYHPFTENSTNLKELREIEICQDCHDPRDNSFGFSAEACHVCHDIEDEELEHHGERTCDMASCHRNELGEPVQPKLTGHNTVIDHCMECHSRDHPDDAFVPYIVTNSVGKTLMVNGSFCGDCHFEISEEFKDIGSKHYEENDCTDCHLEHKSRPDCLDCHNQGSGIEPEHNITSPYDDCNICHTQGGHNPQNVTIQIQRLDMDSRNLSKYFCNSCHQDDVYDNIINNTLHTREEFTDDCLACHEEHEADVECLECHKEGGFEGLVDTPQHITIEPYDVCLDCHTNGHIPESLNLTFYVDTHESPIENDFCADCHSFQKQQLTDFGANHTSQDCYSCHKTHEDDDVDCFTCHTDGGLAPLPSHDIENQFGDCLSCHESGHTPVNITFGVSNIANDFCADISCHGGSDGVVSQFQNYSGNHKAIFPVCTDCHNSHSDDRTCKEVGCHSSSPTGHTVDYTFEQCLECHDTTHSPLKLPLRPGYLLSQREYMSTYFNLDIVDMTNSFTWVPRGNHDEYDDCMECHSDAKTPIYPPGAQSLMNVNSTDCSLGCHSWINTTSTGNPYDLFISATEWVNHTKIFDNTTYGGCAGKCHQQDVQNPVYNGTGHGAINSCLTYNCHGQGSDGFLGKTHDDHKKHVDDFTPITGVECREICHKLGPTSNGDPIDGGCYDCHKSGHDPSIMVSSPCSGCHFGNLPNQD